FGESKVQSVEQALVGGAVERVPPEVTFGGEQVPVDRFNVGHFLQTLRVVGAADTVFLPAAPGGFRQAMAVEVVSEGGDAGFQAGGEGAALFVVAGPDRGGQGQFGVVGFFQGFLGVGHGGDGNDRAEGFFTHHQHVVADPGKQGGGQ